MKAKSLQRAIFDSSLTLMLISVLTSLAHAQTPDPATPPAPGSTVPVPAPSANPSTGNFSVQVPNTAPVQGGMPMGVLPPTQGVQNTTGPVMVVPTVLPPSSGATFVPIQPGQQNTTGGTATYQSPYNSPNTAPPPASAPLQSEIITFDEKTEERPVLVVKTSEGEFKVKMAADVNRQTVQHFMGLAQGSKEFIDVRTGKKVRRPFYTGLNCHRVLKGVLIQCGCPFGNGRGNPGVFAKDERNPGLRFDRPGIIAMALQLRPQGAMLEDAADTAGSQFFISLSKLPEFDGKYAILGEITSGMDTIRKIASTPTGPTDRPIKRVVIFSIDPDITALPVAPVTPLAPAIPAADPMLSPMNNMTPGGMGVDPFALPPPGP